ncbi:MAG: undecaprenyl-phosphate glucose phosphotransferase [Gammaproteobacteria bacterium]|nr:undecaprenyl-phosphate glucose phosphotransferase [Gammaproteobacteria bacterium]
MSSSDKVFRPLAAESAPRVACCDAVHLVTDFIPVFDILCIVSAYFLGILFHDHWQGSTGNSIYSGSNFIQAALIAALPAPFILYNKHFGSIARREDMGRLLRSHLLRYAIFAAFVLALDLFTPALDEFPAKTLLFWVMIGLALTSLVRVVVAFAIRRLKSRGISTETIAIVGAGRVADRLVKALQHSHGDTVELVGIFDDKLNNRPASTVKAVGNIADLLELGKTRKIDWILLALPPTAEKRVLEIIQRLKVLSVPIGLCPENVGTTLPYRTIDFVGDTVPVSLLVDRPIKRWDAVIKTIEDLTIGGMITLVALPVMGLIALAIKIDSRGPIIYKQKRHTLNNQEFYIYKFRTMRWNPTPATDTLKQTSRDDDRITRVGRFLRASSLDEIPQLFNVLKGDMSLVGPRPHAINMRTEERLGNELTATYAHRHRVKPGMTGWAQVNGARGATDNSAQLYRRVRLDLEYIENWSVMLDLKILVQTFGVVVKMTNAF